MRRLILLATALAAIASARFATADDQDGSREDRSSKRNQHNSDRSENNRLRDTWYSGGNVGNNYDEQQAWNPADWFDANPSYNYFSDDYYNRRSGQVGYRDYLSERWHYPGSAWDYDPDYWHDRWDNDFDWNGDFDWNHDEWWD